MNHNNASSNMNNGILLRESSYNTLSNNGVLDNYDGIWLSSCNNNQLSNNIINNSNNGIAIWGDSTSNTLNNNIAANNNVGITINHSSDNCIYNNHFNNTNNVQVENTQSENIWNITKTEGTNIIGGPFIGGNYWAYPNGTGYGQVCEDVDKDKICDSPYNIIGDSSDYLPLSSTQIIDNDSLAPVLSDIVPETGTNDLTPIISINANDGGSGVNITSASMRVDGSLVILTSSQFGSTVKFENTSATTYNHGDIVNVTFSVSDNAGLTSNNTWLFYVDTIIPIITITSPKEGDSTSASSITVSGKVNGTGSPANVTVNDILAGCPKTPNTC